MGGGLQKIAEHAGGERSEAHNNAIWKSNSSLEGQYHVSNFFVAKFHFSFFLILIHSFWNRIALSVLPPFPTDIKNKLQQSPCTTQLKPTKSGFNDQRQSRGPTKCVPRLKDCTKPVNFKEDSFKIPDSF